MQDIKRGIHIFIQIVLWLAFMLSINDPGILGNRPPGNFYGTYFFLVDPIYKVADFFMAPFQAIASFIGIYNFQNPTAWMTASSDMLKFLTSAVHVDGQIALVNNFTGVIRWWIPISSGLYIGLSAVFDFYYEPVRNWFWNIMIEYVFHRKKAKLYEDALEKRNMEMAKLNSRYSSLAQETHSLKDSVITDEMTQVYNKRFFLNRMQQEFDAGKAQGTLMGVIMVDIDYFKKLNDNYGHLVGDEVLKAVAAVIKRYTPDLCYPCRYGGEEFAVIMPKKDLDQATECARLIQENVQLLRFDHIDKKLRVTVSQGICCADFAHPDAAVLPKFENILELADQKLYQSKMEGRNRVSVHAFSKSV